jgi:alkylation response protein AidB-like acyl-CoA dehydrogenase
VRSEAENARRLPAHAEPGLLDVYRRLGERGWLAPNWPVEYGGLGATIVEKTIVTEELIWHGIPDVVHTLATDIVGLAMHLLGTAEQKRHWLPRLAAGTSAGCVLFSEPDTGSDLAALATRAEPDGAGWRLRGRKVYSMKSHLADVGLCAARTSDSAVRYHGITVFVIPMRMPGVIVAPLWSMADERFNDVTLDGPVLTTADVLGEVDAGWQVIEQILAVERTGIEFAAKGTRLVDAIISHAQSTASPMVVPGAERLVEFDAEMRAGRLLSWRAIGNLADGQSDNVLCAMAKWHATETAKAAAAASAEYCGLDAILSARDEQSSPGWLVESAFRDAPGITLASGTSEVMLSLIASAGLGLPT